MGAGFHFIGSILGLTVFGWWLDQRLATTPWLGVTGVLLGFVIGCVGLVRILRVAQGPDDPEPP